MISLSQPAPEPLLIARNARRSFFEARLSQSSAALIAASDEEQRRFTFCAWMSELSERQVVCLRNQANLNDKSPIVVRRDDRLRASPNQAHVR